jgi:hypothetical protein
VAFSAFSAKLAIALGPTPNQDAFGLLASFTLGSTSNGIDPVVMGSPSRPNWRSSRRLHGELSAARGWMTTSMLNVYVPKGLRVKEAGGIAAVRLPIWSVTGSGAAQHRR